MAGQPRASTLIVPENEILDNNALLQENVNLFRLMPTLNANFHALQ